MCAGRRDRRGADHQGKDSFVATKSAAITAKHRAALTALLGTVGDTPFRRSDLAKLIYPLTTPRSHPRATEIAGLVMTEAARNATIRREGHVHWVRVASHRKSRNGRTLVELPAPVPLSINTKVPSKWAFVDLETGEVFAGTETGLVRASSVILSEVKGIVAKA